MDFDGLDDSQISQVSETMESQLQSQVDLENHPRRRKTNYSPGEDETLVRSWLHVSEDAVTGRDQKCTKLWMRILQNFHQRLGKITERDAQGLQNRWQKISQEVSKFSGHYNRIGRIYHSGWNDQMMINEAKQQFGEIESLLHAKPVQFYKFKFEHCWRILKDSSKWNDHVLIRSTVKVSKKLSNSQIQKIDFDDMGIPPPSTSPVSCHTTAVDDVSLDETHHEVRKEGRKKSKAKRKSEAQDDDSVLKSINESLKEATRIEKEKLEAKKRRIEQKELHEERKIMSQSLVGLTSEQVAYWKHQQLQIIERYKANGSMDDPDTHM